MTRLKILSTKKLDPPLKEQAEGNGIDIIESEFISVRSIWSEEKFREIGAFFECEAVAFTSSNAVRAVRDYLLVAKRTEPVPWKIFSLSGKTKDELVSAPFFFRNEKFEADSASFLAEKIIHQGITEIVFYCGDKRRDELPSRLKQAGIKVHEVIVYLTEETPKKLDAECDAVFFFSPSAVDSFFSLNKLDQAAVCFAVGQTTADSVAKYCDNEVIISESPSQRMMLAAADLYFKHH